MQEQYLDMLDKQSGLRQQIADYANAQKQQEQQIAAKLGELEEKCAFQQLNELVDTKFDQKLREMTENQQTQFQTYKNLLDQQKNASQAHYDTVSHTISLIQSQLDTQRKNIVGLCQSCLLTNQEKKDILRS